MTPQEASNLFNKEFQKALKETTFPDDLVPRDFKAWKDISMRYESPMSLGMTVEEYRDCANKSDGFTLFEFAQLSNSIEKKTPKQFDCAIALYLDIQQKIFEGGTQWQEIVAPIRKSIEKKIEIMGGVPNRNKNLKLIPQA